MGCCNGWCKMKFCCSYLLIVLQVFFVNVQGQTPSSYDFINIDCGLRSNTSYVDSFTGLIYVSDDQYIDTGIKGIISSEYILDKNYGNLKTLRSFPTGTKNCYTIRPVTIGSKYLVKATFAYGNYDGLSKPPSFDLYFGTNFWSTVIITKSDYWYDYEIIGIAPANYIEVCLVNTGYGTPFISVLELRPLNNSLYELADSTRSLNSRRRSDIGSNNTYPLRYPKDDHDRLWFNSIDSSWTAISTNFTIEGFTFEVPSLVLQTAAVPTTGSSINISWSTSNSSDQFLVILHFVEIQKLQNNSLREFYLYSNGVLQIKDPIPVTNYLSAAYAYYTTSGYTDYNMSLQSSARATIPPILNGFELYTIMPVIWLPTDGGDVTAINTIKSSYNVKDWSGDPCVPTDLGWTGVICTIDSLNTPRITDLNLSSKGLTSNVVSAFGYFTALEKLDLSHNNLSGNIPNSLDQLISLTFLDLSENSNLLCTLPSGLQKRRDKGLLTVNFSGTAGANVQTKKASKALIIIIAAVVGVLVNAGTAVLFILFLRKHRNTYPGLRINSSTSHDQTGIGMTGSAEMGLNFDKRTFSFEELRLMTNNFTDRVGIGGFGEVFKGQLQSGTEVAVKVRNETSSQGIREFSNEVQMLSRIHHKNLVSLIGYCMDSNHIALVYEYMKGGNLQDCLRGKACLLPWKQRLQIAYESAQGLEYLHKMCNPPLIHRDVKASNILLTLNLEAKISDFGLVRASSSSYVSTQVVGTPGYLDPYYASTSQLTEKSDVYSFGVVLLEIITGKSPILQPAQDGHLVQFVQKRLSKENIESILDINMRGPYNVNSIWMVANLALKCTDRPSNRPDMTAIVMELNESRNLEMSGIEMSSGTSDDLSLLSSVSRNDDRISGTFETVHVGQIGLPDDGPLPR